MLILATLFSCVESVHSNIEPLFSDWNLIDTESTN